MDNAVLRGILLWGGIALKVLVLGKMGWLGVLKRYPVLAVYLGFSLFSSMALLYLNKTSMRLFGLSGYNLFYIVKQPVTWTLYFLVMLEIYSRMLQEYPAVQRLGRLLVFLGLGIATAICGILMTADDPAGSFRHPFLAHLADQERSILLCLAALALVILLFIAHYRIPVRRNQLVLTACFGGYFIASGAFLAMHHYFGDVFFFPRNVLNGLFFLGSLLAAFGLLSRAGEERAEPINALWSRRDEKLEAALLLELRSFNQTLAKALKQ